MSERLEACEHCDADVGEPCGPLCVAGAMHDEYTERNLWFRDSIVAGSVWSEWQLVRRDVGDTPIAELARGRGEWRTITAGDVVSVSATVVVR